MFIPDCEQDGSFRSIQCSGSTGYCWCVTKDGFMIWTTSTRGRPSCDKKGRCMFGVTVKYILEKKTICHCVYEACRLNVFGSSSYSLVIYMSITEIRPRQYLA